MSVTASMGGVRDPLEVDPMPVELPCPPQTFVLPPGAVDTHAHVIGTSLIAERSYTPSPAPPERYLAMLDAVGVSRGVLVQVSVHGTDNALMIETVRSHPKRLRGIAVVELDASDGDLAAMKEAGIVGLRLNATTGGGVGTGRLKEYGAMCAELGWHLQLLVAPDQLFDVSRALHTVSVPVVFDHMGYVQPGAQSRDARDALLGMVRDGAWIKLSGAFRLTHEGPPYSDTTPLAQELIDAAPNRCVWGSDWPHVSFRGPMPDPGDLLDLLAKWAPAEPQRTDILVHNPRRLYGFPEP